MQLGEHVGDRNNPVIRLVCQVCGQEVFTMGRMTFDASMHQAALEVEKPEHEHEIAYETRVVS